jgi:hypothetical protein
MFVSSSHMEFVMSHASPACRAGVGLSIKSSHGGSLRDVGPRLGGMVSVGEARIVIRIASLAVLFTVIKLAL